MKEDYIYSSTYVRTIEKNLLNKTDIEQMANAATYDEALNLLTKAAYSKELKESVSNAADKDYEQILENDLQKAKKLLLSLTNNKDLIKFVLLPFDIHNIKLFYKEKFFEKNLQEFISPYGSQNPEELKKSVYGKKANIDQGFQKIIKQAQEKFKTKPSPCYIDGYLDKKAEELSLETAKKMKSSFLVNFLERKIDIINLKTVIRCCMFNSVNILKKLLIANSRIKKNLILERIGKTQDIKEILVSLKSVFSEEIQKVIDSFLKKNKSSIYENISKLFKELKDVEISWLRESKFINNGPAIIACYFLARFNANQNIKIIMKGKINCLENKEIIEKTISPF